MAWPQVRGEMTKQEVEEAVDAKRKAKPVRKEVRARPVPPINTLLHVLNAYLFPVRASQLLDQSLRHSFCRASCRDNPSELSDEHRMGDPRDGNVHRKNEPA